MKLMTNYIHYSLLLLCLLNLLACSTTEKVSDSNQASSDSFQFYGAKLSAGEEDLPTCDSTRQGQLFYVLDIEEFRFCTLEGYQALDLTGVDGANGSDGIDGKDGATGAPGATGAEGINGTNGADALSCDIVDNGNSSKTIECEDGTSETVLSGTLCTVKALSDSYTITCGETSVVVKQGIDGRNGTVLIQGLNRPLHFTGKDGDTYIEVSTGTTYQKVLGAWAVLYSETLPDACNLAGNCGLFDDTRDNLVEAYRWVKIGSQTWMAENLNYETASSVCYENNPDNCKAFGQLYTWDEAVNEACPQGWHLPTKAEWDVLFTTAGDVKGDVGRVLRSSIGWITPGNGIDSLGFSALPGGSFMKDFSGISQISQWWNSDITDPDLASGVFTTFEYTYFGSVLTSQESQLSVRCLKD